MAADHVQIAIDSQLSEVPQVAIAARDAAIQAGFHADIAEQLRLCVAEAVNNSIEHAYDNEPGHKVELLIILQNDLIRFEVADTGRALPFNLLEQARVLPEYDATDLNSLPDGGWGLYLILSLMDSVRYATHGPRNCLTMTKYHKLKCPPNNGNKDISFGA